MKRTNPGKERNAGGAVATPSDQGSVAFEWEVAVRARHEEPTPRSQDPVDLRHRGIEIRDVFQDLDRGDDVERAGPVWHRHGVNEGYPEAIENDGNFMA